MSDHRLDAMDGVDAEAAACSLMDDVSEAMTPQSAAVNQSKQSSDKSRELDGVCMPDTAATTIGSVSLNQSSSSDPDNVDSEKFAGGDCQSASEPSEAAAAACGGNSNLPSAAELDAMIACEQQLLDRIKAEQEEFSNQIEHAKAEIHRAAEISCGAVDNCVNSLLASAAELKSERVAQLDETKSRLESAIASMNFHHLFAQELLQHGTPEQLTYYAPRLHEHAERILRQPLPELPQMTPQAEGKLASLQAFAGLNLEDLRRQAGGNMLGNITCTEAVDTSLLEGESPYLNEPRLIASTAADNGVCGVAFLGVCLFVVRDRSSVVEAYETSEGLEPQRSINVEQMTDPTSIVACSSADCLFVNDSEVSGLFRIPSSADAEVTLIPLESIPVSLSVTADGCVVVIFADSPVIQTISSADGSIKNQISTGPVDRPISVLPVNGEDNGFLVCNVTNDGLDWYVCGHQLEVAAARSLEEPIRLRSLRNMSGLTADPFGSYIAFSTAQNSVKVFDSTFALLRTLLRAHEHVQYPMALALNPISGRVAIGQQNGVIRLYKLLRTRETIEVGIHSWL